MNFVIQSHWGNNTTWLTIQPIIRYQHTMTSQLESSSNQNCRWSHHSESPVQSDRFSVQVRIFNDCLTHLSKFVGISKSLGKHYWVGQSINGFLRQGCQQGGIEHSYKIKQPKITWWSVSFLKVRVAVHTVWTLLCVSFSSFVSLFHLKDCLPLAHVAFEKIT